MQAKENKKYPLNPIFYRREDCWKIFHSNSLNKLRLVFCDKTSQKISMSFFKSIWCWFKQDMYLLIRIVNCLFTSSWISYHRNLAKYAYICTNSNKRLESLCLFSNHYKRTFLYFKRRFNFELQICFPITKLWNLLFRGSLRTLWLSFFGQIYFSFVFFFCQDKYFLACWLCIPLFSLCLNVDELSSDR